MENFHQLIVNRRSIRRYTSEQLSADDVKLILEAGLLAPSSKSARVWQFIAVDSPEMLERLSHCKPAYATSIAGASLAVIIAVDTTKTDAWIEDASVAAIMMQLQAEDLGLGSCWVQVRGRFTGDDMPSEEYVQECLGMPEHVIPVCILTFGHKDEERKPQNLDRLKWENVHIGTWKNVD